MTHYKTLLDPSKYLGPADFPTERTVKISRVVREKKPTRDGEPEESGVMLYIIAKDGTEYPRPLPIRSTMMYAMASVFGSEIEAWAGKEVPLYRTTCLSFGDVEECVRIRLDATLEKKIAARLKKRKASPKTWSMELAGGRP